MDVRIFDLLIRFILLFGGFLIFYGFFISASTALSRSAIADLKTLSQQGVFFSDLAQKLLERIGHYTLACQLGQLLSATAFGWALLGFIQTGAVIISGEVTRYYDLGSVGWLLVAFASVSILCLLTLATSQILKSLVARNPDRSLCILAFPLRIFGLIIYPLIIVVNSVSNKLFKTLNIAPIDDRYVVQSLEEIQEIVDRSSKAGEIGDEERELIQGIFAFSNTVVTEVMTPRKDVAFVRIGQSLPAIAEVFRTTGFSRLLVCGEDLDDVQGVLLLKDLLPFVGKEGMSFDAVFIMRPVYFCSVVTPINDLLEELRSSAVHLAVVRDEHGGVDGLVTLEDLVEEIVGEILDEYDIGEEKKSVKLHGSGDLLVDGTMTISDLNEIYGLKIPEGDYSTIAGFVMQRLGKIPFKGESLHSDGLEIRVERVIRNRVRLIRIARPDSSVKRLKLVESGTSADKNNPESNRLKNESKDRGKLA